MPVEDIPFRTKVLKSFLWLGTGTFLVQLISWASTIFVIRLLFPSDYGLMAMATTFISLLTTISELGIGSAIIQADQLQEKEIRQLFGFCILTGIFGFIVSYAAAPLIASFFKEPKLVTLVRFLGLNFILLSLYMVPQMSFVREMNFKTKAQVDVITQTGGAILTLILALNGLGVWALAVGTVSFHIFKAIGFNVARTSFVRPSFRFGGAEKFIKYGLTVTGARLFYYLYTESDKIIIGKFLGNNLLGYYGVALNLASIPMEKVLPIVNQVLFTSYSRIQNDIERIRKNILTTTRAVAFLSFPIFFGMAGLSREAVPLILGPKWTSIVVPFQLLCLIIPLKALNAIFSPALSAIGKPSVTLRNTIITSIVMAIAFLIGIRGELLGVCIAWIIAYPIVFIVTGMRYLKELGISWRDYLSEIIFPFFAGLLMLVFVMLLRQFIIIFQPLYSIIITISFGTAIYMGLAFIFKKDEYLELKRLLYR